MPEEVFRARQVGTHSWVLRSARSAGSFLKDKNTKSGSTEAPTKLDNDRIINGREQLYNLDLEYFSNAERAAVKKKKQLKRQAFYELSASGHDDNDTG